MNNLKDHWTANGAKWIFIVTDAASPEAADEWLLGRYVTFGWRTNDVDNSEGAGAIMYSSVFEGLPWIGVIRTSDMQLVHDEPDDGALDIRSIAEELAAE